MSPRALKVYGWQDSLALVRIPAGRDVVHPLFRDPGWRPYYSQICAIVAATSKAEVARIVSALLGYAVPARSLFNLGETGNALDIETATGRPGVVFVRHMGSGPDRYYPIEPKEAETES